MRIDIACFSGQGFALGKRLEEALRNAGDAARLSRCGVDAPLRQWAAERFRDADALVFIGAAGIAVRAIAPHIVAKTSDPAVVVLDDTGRFAIPLLSGHIGGANGLAEKIAALVGAMPVVTTSTDRNGVFAIDVWARRNGFAIVNPERIKTVSAKLLSGLEARLYSAFPVAGRLPDEIALAADCFDVLVDIRVPAASDALCLVPPAAVLGLGCRKGVSAETIERAFAAFCEAAGVFPQAFGKVCSIDMKAAEPGILAFCEKRGLPFETYGIDVLERVDGEFAFSPFVSAVAGIGTVCERSAVAGSGEGGELLAGKTVIDGIAMAAAVRKYRVRFAADGGEDE